VTDNSSIALIRAAFETGAISRDEYWHELQLRHAALEEYEELISGVLDHIEVRREGLQIALRNGLRFWWNPTDLRTAPNMVVAHGDYESSERAVMETLAVGAGSVVDVGANVGWYALHFARIVGPAGGRVFSFEPVPTTFGALRQNCDLNPECAWIELHNLGLSDSPGSARFSVPSETGSVAASARAIKPEESNSVVEVEMSTLDTVLGERDCGPVGLIKCDIEGAELFALRGGLGLIERDRPVLAVEMLRKWTAVYDYHPNDIIDLLSPIGYTCWAVADAGLRPVEQVTEETVATNFFFFAEGHEAQRLAVQGVLSTTPPKQGG